MSLFVNFNYLKIKLSIEKCFFVSASILKKNAASIQNKRLGFRASGLRETRIKLIKESKPWIQVPQKNVLASPYPPFPRKTSFVGFRSFWLVQVIYQTRKTVFDHIFKHGEVSWKYDEQRSIFDELRGVSKCGQTLSWVFDRPFA